jgi:hypothetical protein
MLVTMATSLSPPEPDSTPTGCSTCDCSAFTGAEDARFCADCGHSRDDHGHRACPSCAAPLEAAARFCGACGEPVAAEAQVQQPVIQREAAAPQADAASEARGAGPNERAAVATQVGRGGFAIPVQKGGVSRLGSWADEHKVITGILIVVIALVAIGGCAALSQSPSATRGASQQEGGDDSGSQYFAAGYPRPSEVDASLVKHFEAEGSVVQSHHCEYFAASLGPPPVVNCTFKVDGEWHDDIEATGHPDGTFSWDDYTR